MYKTNLSHYCSKRRGELYQIKMLNLNWKKTRHSCWTLNLVYKLKRHIALMVFSPSPSSMVYFLYDFRLSRYFDLREFSKSLFQGNFSIIPLVKRSIITGTKGTIEVNIFNWLGRQHLKCTFFCMHICIYYNIHIAISWKEKKKIVK